MRAEKKRKLFGGGCFFGLLGLTLAILAVELFNSSRRVNKLLLARIKRVTVRANINMHIFYRGINLSLIPTCTSDFRFKVIWMYIGLHNLRIFLHFKNS